jgi:putative RecB family exonuclease
MEAPSYLSPSSIATYRDCPQKFKLSRIEKIPQPPTWAIHVGSFVHEVLEHLYQVDPDDRIHDTLKSLAADRWAVSDWEQKVAALAEPQGSIKDFKVQAFKCMTNLWYLEDPRETELDGMEHEVTAEVEGVAMKGFIDRFIFGDNGIVISDYKTGKIPNPKFTSEDDKFFQLLAYAAMIEAADEEPTERVQLLYLGVPVSHELAVTPVNLSIAKGTIVETREGVDAAVARGEFPCNVTKLCDWCHYKASSDCPAFQ